ncbi:hypothetical protein [Halobacillus trueperi]|uniref:DUF5050 domain-containing protein n=1 Tax=Halobacillus trueperi TaxID=156205 RepID=A0A3E0JBR1_9BACI|nr:hypothetical protein [Halobacillus trueperi]REJ10375.1 hypothetical protein DYE48_02490 [Halobacillus trueperi]
MKKYLLIAIIIIIAFITLANIRIPILSETFKTNEQSNLFIRSTGLDYTTSYYLYNIATNEKDIVFQKKMTSHPTSAFHPKNETFFYTDTDSNGLNQLFQFDMKSNKSRQLTNINGSIDFLKLSTTQSKIYMRINLYDNQNFHIGTYDINNGSINIWNKNEKDKSIKHFDLNTESGSLILLSYSAKENEKKIEEANKEGEELKPLNYEISIVNKDKGIKRKIKSLKKHIHDISISNDSQAALISYYEVFGQSNSKSVIAEIDLETGKTKPLIKEGKKLTSFKHPQYAGNLDGIYFIAKRKDQEIKTDDKGGKFKPSNLYLYDLETKDISEVLRVSNATINNFSVVDSYN